VVAIDLVIILARTIKLLNSETVAKPMFRFVRLASYIFIPAVIVICGSWNNNRLQVKNMLIEHSEYGFNCFLGSEYPKSDRNPTMKVL
jgi:hypothetical protein